jgi:large subunit ribosomal protein L23
MSLILTLKPRVSEKTYAHSEQLNVYVFVVPSEINALSVKKAVEAQYKVKVTKVNILNQKGKVKRTYRRGGRSVEGKRSDFKKAYVTLKEGDILPIFGTVDEIKNEQKPAKSDKAPRGAK